MTRRRNKIAKRKHAGVNSTGVERERKSVIRRGKREEKEKELAKHQVKTPAARAQRVSVPSFSSSVHPLLFLSCSARSGVCAQAHRRHTGAGAGRGDNAAHHRALRYAVAEKEEAMETSRHQQKTEAPCTLSSTGNHASTQTHRQAHTFRRTDIRTRTLTGRLRVRQHSAILHYWS